MLVETGKKIFCLSLDTGKQSGTFRALNCPPGSVAALSTQTATDTPA